MDLNVDNVLKVAGITLAVMFVHEVAAANGWIDIRSLAAKVKLPSLPGRTPAAGSVTP